MVDAVQDSYIAYLSSTIAERAFRGETIDGYAEARGIFLAWRKELDKEFSSSPPLPETRFEESE